MLVAWMTTATEPEVPVEVVAPLAGAGGRANQEAERIHGLSAVCSAWQCHHVGLPRATVKRPPCSSRSCPEDEAGPARLHHWL